MLPNGPFYQDTGGNWVFVVAPGGGHRRDAATCGWAGAIPNLSKWWMGSSRARRSSSRATRPIQKMDRVEFESADNSDNQ